MFQSRRSLLVWKVFGRRLDGWDNDDFPTEATPGDPRTLRLKGEPVANTPANRNRADLDYTGSVMPPPEAVKAGKVAALTGEDRLTLVRWIDLGCPIDLDYDSANPTRTGYGWMLDEQRPTVALAIPGPGANTELSRILVGVADYGSGLDMKSLSVTADFAIDGASAGTNLAAKLRPAGQGVLEYRFAQPIASLPHGVVTIRVADNQGNVTRVERTIRVGAR